jgi:hypothetical protein
MRRADDIPTELLEAINKGVDRSSAPLMFPRPVPGSSAAVTSFATFADWSEYVRGFQVSEAIPLTVRTKLSRASKLYLLAWIDPDLVTVGELTLLVALELALKDRYGGKVRRRDGSIAFADLLRHVVEVEGVTDRSLPRTHRTGGRVVDLLTGTRKPSLAQIRNQLAHGEPFNGLPWGGLLELVFDLVEYAFRDMIAEAEAPGITR